MPDVLRSGDHPRIRRWRRAQALARTIGHRPDLIEARGGLTADEEPCSGSSASTRETIEIA
ncbi:MAG: hypothetical protein U5R31_12630 [Acidimicrobiia bacterium]|nr:hypothetical protein [Acidimicrobiia bacterium]